MTDLSTTIAPKSNQLNADDLITGPRTIKITNVTAADAEQPIAVRFEGDNNKPYFPCKSMRRVLVQVWGNDGKSYIGRSMTIYRDPEVIFGGIKVGGIRISHMTGIKEPMTMALTASKTKRAAFTVKPLAIQETKPPEKKPEPAASPEPAAPSEPAPQDTIDDLTELLTTALTGDDIRAAAEKIAASGLSPEQKKEMQATYKIHVARVREMAGE